MEYVELSGLAWALHLLAAFNPISELGMQLTKLSIQNYKSLRGIEIMPRDFSVIIGRNSSGKSNFADAIEFLSLAYADGLEHAVARKGGYENLAHRKEKRSRSAIVFSIEMQAELSEDDAAAAHLVHTVKNGPISRWTFRHQFEFRAYGEGIRSDFKIVTEKLDVIKEPIVLDKIASGKYEWINIERKNDGRVAVTGDLESQLSRAVLFDPKYWTAEGLSDFVLPPTELLFVMPFFRPRVVGRFTSWIKNFAVFQLSPDVSRHPGVPTPNPHLSARGENLPAVIDWMQRKQPKDWKSILQAMRDIVPELQDISVNYLHTRTLGLFFHEAKIGRPWTAEEVSDGTIRALSILVACFDPRNTALIVEEPENSLHPWIIKEIMTHLRRLSEKKLVMVTSHSPVVLNMLSPEQVWVIYKTDGETNIKPLVQFDDNLLGDWESGKYKLFEYLESGYVSEAVP